MTKMVRLESFLFGQIEPSKVKREAHRYGRNTYLMSKFRAAIFLEEAALNQRIFLMINLIKNKGEDFSNFGKMLYSAKEWKLYHRP